jgi:transcriptional regulator with XRE-family HTH domain
MMILPAEPRLIGPALKQLRHLHGMTQLDLVKAGVGGQNVISALENGHTMPFLPTVNTYLKALGYTLAAVPLPEENDDERQQSEAESTSMDEIHPVDAISAI